MAKAAKRKLKVTKAERRTILKAAANRKPKGEKAENPQKGGKQKTPLKTPPWKADRPKRKPEPASRETIVTVRKPRGPDLKPRKRRSMSMNTKNAKHEGDEPEDEDVKAKDVKGAKGADVGDKDAKEGEAPPEPETVMVYDASSGQMKKMAVP